MARVRGVEGGSPSRLNFFNFLDGTFPRQHDEVAAEFTGEFNAAGAGNGHLRRGVYRKIRREPADEPANAHVLHNHRVHAGGHHRAQIFFRVSQFVFKDQRVQRHVAAHAAPVQKFHQLRQIRLRKIVRPHPGVEFFEAEINRVRAIFDCCAGAVPIAGGRQQFRQKRRAGGFLSVPNGIPCWCHGHLRNSITPKVRRTKPVSPVVRAFAIARFGVNLER